MVLNIKNFSDELHYEAKVQAAIEGISLKELIEKSLREYLKSAKKKTLPGFQWGTGYDRLVFQKETSHARYRFVSSSLGA
jgi:hypothetical protein